MHTIGWHGFDSQPCNPFSSGAAASLKGSPIGPVHIQISCAVFPRCCFLHRFLRGFLFFFCGFLLSVFYCFVRFSVVLFRFLFFCLASFFLSVIPLCFFFSFFLFSSLSLLITKMVTAYYQMFIVLGKMFIIYCENSSSLRYENVQRILWNCSTYFLLKV